jgi:hypothetical protein
MFESLESRTFLSAAAAPPVQHFVHGWRRDPAAVGIEEGKRRAAGSNLLMVGPNGRYVTSADGSPFFYMADTAWHLLDKLKRADVDTYLQTRAAQGFTVIQAEVNARFGRNAYGDAAFANNDPSRPNEAYFKNVDYVINKANALGMYVALVPMDSTWSQNGKFNVDNAYQYGRYLGARYASSKIVWVLGGDVKGDGGGGQRMWAELAGGIARGAANRDFSKVMMTFHPYGGMSSSTWFQAPGWIDFTGIQSGQVKDKANYNMVAADYAKSPMRPVMDIEPGYEDIPSGLKRGNERLTAYDVRKTAYWSLFAGSFGVTYGNNNVWQFVTSPGGGDLATMSWRDALASAGANSMSVLKRLMLSRPQQNRVPDQSLVVGSTLSGSDHVQATRAADGSYAFVYTAGGKTVTVNLTKLSGPLVTARWYNPRSGKSALLGTFAKSGNKTFVAPSSGVNNDWVLVLDDASKAFGKP